ncbi:hypothetical protein As57867_009749, partial [Aphanomyces stellatus]
MPLEPEPAPSPVEDIQVDDHLLEKEEQSSTTIEASVTKTHYLTYRPDIDGLRTLAVVPVVVFHAYPTAFPGGFIGVDIFFVISGYLISGILLKEMTHDTFTYANFYSRRVRRIFPVLLLVLASTLWMGCLYLLASSLKALAATMLAGSLFCANLQILSLEKGYFDDDVKSNPLLHLWSLGVEEQFYIFWPFFVSLLAKLSFRKAIAAQLVVLTLSFSLNVSMLGYHGTNKVAFYFPLCRFWQMSMGGLLAYLANQPPVASSTKAWLPSVQSYAGLLMVLLGFACIDESSVFPGFWALLPSCGASLLIAAGPSAPFNAYILSSSPMVFLGKISYALYLWHWPLLVFANTRFPNTRPFYMQPFVMLLVAMALSLNFTGFENRVRRLRSKFVVPSLTLAMLVVIVLSYNVYSHPSSFSMTELDL